MGSRPRGREAQEEVGEAEWEKDWMHLASLITENYSSPGNSSLSEECLTSGSRREQNRRPDRRLGLLVWTGGHWKGRRGSVTLSSRIPFTTLQRARSQSLASGSSRRSQIISFKGGMGPQPPPRGSEHHLQQVLPTPINVPQRTSSIIRTLSKG